MQEKVLIGLRLCLLHFMFNLCQGHFHGEIRTHVLAFVSVLVLASLVKFLKTNCKKNRQTHEILDSSENF